MEMIVALVIAVFLIGWYVRAQAEADSLADTIRGSDAVKLYRDVRERRANMLGVAWADPAETENDVDGAQPTRGIAADPTSDAAAPVEAPENTAEPTDSAGDAALDNE